MCLDFKVLKKDMNNYSNCYYMFLLIHVASTSAYQLTCDDRCHREDLTKLPADLCQAAETAAWAAASAAAVAPKVAMRRLEVQLIEWAQMRSL